ncbi:MAG: mechanosensitive ion channel protein MscS [Bacteroidetes bacterium HGW-Bacteroidetes-6]|jgi:small conductance mechanosensitive channel|nr:MAG: mechanosensitive ion channel protein MscS [Bacteroidetes bacterium HGW-Bacteroidetes-6]
MADQISDVNIYFDKFINFCFEYGPNLIGAILVLVIGLWITRIITKSVAKTLLKKNTDPSLIPFIRGLIGVVLKILIIISVMGMVGIQMTSFIALLGAAGLAIGMALSGTLQNFAGGIILLVFKPFKAGDFIEAQGYIGTVKGISIFTTTLNTVDKKLVIIPNGPLATGPMTNFSTEPIRRVDWNFGIAYGDDMENFKKAIADFISEDERILDDPAFFIGLSEFGDSSVNFTVRAWVNSENYWDVFFDMNEKVYKRFGEYKLNIPFPQMDIHMTKN